MKIIIDKGMLKLFVKEGMDSALSYNNLSEEQKENVKRSVLKQIEEESIPFLPYKEYFDRKENNNT